MPIQAPFKQSSPSARLLYGVAYYDEYMPVERLDKDIAMMKDAGINVVRVGESTWGTMEPQEGVFDFTHLDRVLNAMHPADIGVIVGTPTYAVPTWLARKHPEVLSITPTGPAHYGPRQNMDITNPHFLEAAERVIRKMMERVKDHPAVIGYQVDNETKPYHTAGPDVQKQFVEYCKKKFKTLDALNSAFGLNYWSNRINTWEDFPSTVGSINASLSSEFAKFQRQLVTDYLAWQVRIVNETKRPGQFVTQNFDADWRGHSFGIQTEVDHFAAAQALDVAGIDIYHPTQDSLTGIEIAFGGDLARSMKGGQNYYVMETQAQGFPAWVPYPGQLRLQAYSHLASGADMVSYWHWHSIHNSAETYWKGLLSHDFSPNPTYLEARIIGGEFAKLGPHLLGLQKHNQVAILFSNEALTAFNLFGFGLKYNDVLRRFYDALYKMNVEVDFVDPSSTRLDKYKLIVVPALYAASDRLLQRLNDFVKNGGHVVYSFASGFSNENVQARHRQQPGIIDEACGIAYDQFTQPVNVGLTDHPFEIDPGDKPVQFWMELITPTTARVAARYKHPVWSKYAAITENQYGQGRATYIGFMPSAAVVDKILRPAVRKANIQPSGPGFPVICKSGVNQAGKTVRYYFNYSGEEVTCIYQHATGTELFSGTNIATGAKLTLHPWGFQIIVCEPEPGASL